MTFDAAISQPFGTHWKHFAEQHMTTKRRMMSKSTSEPLYASIYALPYLQVHATRP